MTSEPQWAESLVEQRCAAGQHVTWFVDRDAAFPCPWCQRDAARTDVMAELLDAKRRAEQAETEVKRLSIARVMMTIFGVPEEAPQPFTLIGDDDKPFALGVQWPGGAVTVKSTPPERLGNTTSPSLEDFFTEYGKSNVVWLSEDLGSLAEQEQRAERAESAMARVREEADWYDAHRGGMFDGGLVAAGIRRVLDGGDAS